jgi:MarR family transcriptional regulator, organic hydroperoxide resistance regulator
MTATRRTRAEREAEVSQRVLRHWHEAVPNDRMAHLVKDATRSFQRSLQARLAPHGVSFGHWTFLRILWDRDGLTKRELSIEAGVMEPTTVVALRAMESLGYVSLEQRPENRKNVYVFLTPRGRRLQQVLVPLAEAVNAVALQGLGPTEIAAARHALLVMVDNLARDAVVLGEPEAPADRERAAPRAPRGAAPTRARADGPARTRSRD